MASGARRQHGSHLHRGRRDDDGKVEEEEVAPSSSSSAAAAAAKAPSAGGREGTDAKFLETRLPLHIQLRPAFNFTITTNIWRQILQCLHVDGDKNEGFGRNKTGAKGN